MPAEYKKKYKNKRLYLPNPKAYAQSINKIDHNTRYDTQTLHKASKPRFEDIQLKCTMANEVDKGTTLVEDGTVGHKESWTPGVFATSLSEARKATQGEALYWW